MATTTKARAPAADNYLRLVRQFPLRPIRNAKEHETALDIVSKLIGRKLDQGSSDYLDTLVLLVNKYEDEHHAINDSMSPQEALRALMSFNSLRQSDIAEVMGSESAVSMFLSGKRSLSKAQIKKLADRFSIDAAAFMD